MPGVVSSLAMSFTNHIIDECKLEVITVISARSHDKVASMDKQLKSSNARITQQDVAHKAGVSRGIVSQEI
jgi:hypothetical protein